MREPRSVFADCSPRTQAMASARFDLPQPFGPTMAATPSPWNLNSVRSQNDLNPRICSFFSLSNLHSLCGAILEQGQMLAPHARAARLRTRASAPEQLYLRSKGEST